MPSLIGLTRCLNYAKLHELFLVRRPYGHESDGSLVMRMCSVNRDEKAGVSDASFH